MLAAPADRRAVWPLCIRLCVNATWCTANALMFKTLCAGMCEAAVLIILAVAKKNLFRRSSCYVGECRQPNYGKLNDKQLSDAPPAAGTLFWLLTSNSYPDYDGYTVHTSRVAASEPRPAWPHLTPELFEAVRCSLRPIMHTIGTGA